MHSIYMVTDEIIQLYNDGKSVPIIAELAKSSTQSIYRLLKINNIPRRKTSESNKINFLNKKSSFSVPTRLTTKEKLIWSMGLSLYLGEGNKRHDDTVDLANCNEQIIKIFLRMLREIYRVDETRLRVLVYCHDNRNINDIINYWSTVTNIPVKQFTKPYIKASSIGHNSDKMRYGLIHIRYSDKKLWWKIMEDLDRLINNLLG